MSFSDFEFESSLGFDFDDSFDDDFEDNFDDDFEDDFDEEDDAYLDDLDEDLLDDVFTEEEDYDEPYDDVEAEDGVINYKNHHEEFSAEDDFDDFYKVTPDHFHMEGYEFNEFSEKIPVAI